MARGRPAREAANAAEAAGRSAPAGSRTRTYRPTGQGRGTGFTGPPLPRRAGPEPVGRARHRHCSDASRAAAHQLASAGLTSREEGMIPADVLQSQCAGKWPPAAVTRAAAGTGDLTPSTWHAVELSRNDQFRAPVKASYPEPERLQIDLGQSDCQGAVPCGTEIDLGPVTLGAMDSSPDAPKPTAKDIAARFRREIADGEREPGSRLPAARQLAKDLGVQLMTVQSAYGQLREEGLVLSQQGRGTCLLYTSPSPRDS